MCCDSETALSKAYMTEIETRHQIMLQGFTANMDSQDIPIDFTGCIPVHPHTLSTVSFKTVI